MLNKKPLPGLAETMKKANLVPEVHPDLREREQQYRVELMSLPTQALEFMKFMYMQKGLFARAELVNKVIEFRKSKGVRDHWYTSYAQSMARHCSRYGFTPAMFAYLHNQDQESAIRDVRTSIHCTMQRLEQNKLFGKFMKQNE